MIQDHDDSERLIETVKRSAAQKRQLNVVGHGSKAFRGFERSGDVLCTADHQGIEDYRPDELVVTVRAGTSLEDLSRELARHGQMLGADPPQFDGKGTIGGVIAAGLSGPARPWFGSLRDSVLGIEIINGLGERLRFGGRVVKNVAGYDLSRLMVGSYGTLGVVLSASLKVVPRPPRTTTVRKELLYTEAHQELRRLTRANVPVSATCYLDGMLHIRLSGHSEALDSVLEQFESFEESHSDEFWNGIRDHDHRFFQDGLPTWRVTTQLGSSVHEIDAESALHEWNGALLWVKGPQPQFPNAVDVTPFRNAPSSTGRSSKYYERIKYAFDPHRILNAGVVL